MTDAAMLLRAPFQRAAPGGPNNLQGALDPRRVGGVQRPRHAWVFGLQGSKSLRDRHGAHRSAYRGVDRRDRRDPVQQRAQIQAGPAHQNRQPVGCPGRLDFGQRVCGPARGGAVFGAIQITEQPVRDIAALITRRLGAEHGQIAIDLRAVGIDDDRWHASCQGNRQRRLAAGRRTCDQRQRPFVIRRIHVHRHADSSRNAFAG